MSGWVMCKSCFILNRADELECRKCGAAMSGSEVQAARKREGDWNPGIGESDQSPVENENDADDESGAETDDKINGESSQYPFLNEPPDGFRIIAGDVDPGSSVNIGPEMDFGNIAGEVEPDLEVEVLDAEEIDAATIDAGDAEKLEPSTDESSSDMTGSEEGNAAS